MNSSLVGGVVAAATARAVLRHPAARRVRATNYRGRSVTLAGGPAVALGATLGTSLEAWLRRQPARAAAAVIAGSIAGAVGRYDDVRGDPEKGLEGHLGALRAGRLTSGAVKVAGLGVAGLAATALVDARRAGNQSKRVAGVIAGAAVVAGLANVVNLLDLRPGRALKVGVALSLVAPVAGALGAGAAVLPDDLAERTMLGDSGANALGALLGLRLVERTGLAGRAAILAGVVALTVASERISFSEVIDRQPVLSALDRAGRRE